MPFHGGFQYSINNNRIVYVADVTIPAAFKIKTDTITETTEGNGINIPIGNTALLMASAFGGL